MESPDMQIIPPTSVSSREVQLRTKAQELETTFLSEMLSHAGMGKAQGSFGGGIGEDQFASFLRNAQATAMVDRGGLGLAEHFFQALMMRGGNAE
jgi:peptidoglycan hydrolase FlgJ